jgi:hypothetical protein
MLKHPVFILLLLLPAVHLAGQNQREMGIKEYGLPSANIQHMVINIPVG